MSERLIQRHKNSIMHKTKWEPTLFCFYAVLSGYKHKVVAQGHAWPGTCSTGTCFIQWLARP